MAYKIVILSFCLMISLSAQYPEISLSYNSFLYEDLSRDSLENNYTSFTLLQANEESKKSVGKALFLSLFIPGAGEFYVDDLFYTKLFFGIELAAIGTYVLTDYVYRSKLEDSQVYATTHAGVNPNGKDDEYWRVIGKYDDIFLYNQQRLKQRRVGEYITDNELNNWSWDSQKNRYNYDRKRIDAQVIRDSGSFIITAIFVNHLISAINAVRLTRKYNKKLADNGIKYNLVMSKNNTINKYIGLAISKSF